MLILGSLNQCTKPSLKIQFFMKECLTFYIYSFIVLSHNFFCFINNLVPSPSYWGALRNCKMQFFARAVNWKPLIVYVKNSILDYWLDFWIRLWVIYIYLASSFTICFSDGRFLVFVWITSIFYLRKFLSQLILFAQYFNGVYKVAMNVSVFYCFFPKMTAELSRLMH